MPYQERSYRNHTRTDGLQSFTVTVQETDLFISAANKFEKEARDAVVTARGIIEQYIGIHPEFLSALSPLPMDHRAPEIIRKMLYAGKQSGVGPMAAVAGAVAGHTVCQLLKFTDEVLVENGGDIYFKMNREITISIFAGPSPLSEKIGIRIPVQSSGYAVCTSSGSVGPSLSLGSADAVTLLSPSPFLADAAATAVGNRVKTENDIKSGIDFAKTIPGIDGIVIVKNDRLGVWGQVELVRL